MKKPFKNTAAHPVWIDGEMIPPSETSMVDAKRLPPEPDLPALDVEPEPEDPEMQAGELMMLSVRELQPMLPDLADEVLAVIDREDDRKSLQEAVTAEWLRRAAETTEDA